AERRTHRCGEGNQQGPLENVHTSISSRATGASKLRRHCTTSADTGSGQGVGRPLDLGERLDVLHTAVRAIDAGDVVTTGDEVVEHVVVRVRRLGIVVVGHVSEGTTIELASGIELVGGQGDPAVLVEVEGALAVDVALT